VVDSEGGGWTGRFRKLRESRSVRWLERLVWAGVWIFVLIRIGPQVVALTGVGPVEGSVPQWSAVTLEGERVDAEALRGRVVVVNFWASWCGPCRLEVPALQSLWEEHGGDRGVGRVAVVGVSIDSDRAAAERFLAERGVTYPVVMATPALEEAFGGVRGVPTTFILDGGGVVHHRVYGYFVPPAMRAAVQRLLEESE